MRHGQSVQLDRVHVHSQTSVETKECASHLYERGSYQPMSEGSTTERLAIACVLLLSFPDFAIKNAYVDTTLSILDSKLMLSALSETSDASHILHQRGTYCYNLARAKA